MKKIIFSVIIISFLSLLLVGEMEAVSNNVFTGISVRTVKQNAADIPVDISVKKSGTWRIDHGKAVSSGYTSCEIDNCGRAIGTVHNFSGWYIFSGKFLFLFYDAYGRVIDSTWVTGKMDLNGDDTEYEVVMAPQKAVACSFDVSAATSEYPITPPQYPTQPVQPIPSPSYPPAQGTASGSGSMSKSCSGSLSGYGYFYIYAYQYAYISGGMVSSENHNFNFSGFLGDDEDYVMQKRVAKHHIIYNGPEYSIAIPWESDYGIYINVPNADGGTEVFSNWTLLCK
ncbi:MAG: hypothetical protein L6420_10145 [Elusimicrobia bacterium]|nr:hypothetical protein [Elusimicrobiota bacterium]